MRLTIITNHHKTAVKAYCSSQNTGNKSSGGLIKAKPLRIVIRAAQHGQSIRLQLCNNIVKLQSVIQYMK